MQKIMQVQGNPGSEYVEIGILYIYIYDSTMLSMSRSGFWLNALLQVVFA